MALQLPKIILNQEQIYLNIGFDAKRLFLNNAGLGNYSRWLVKGLLSQFPENAYHLYTPNVSEKEKEFNKENVYTHLAPNLFKTFWRTKGIKKDLIKDKINVYHGLSNELPMGIEKTGIKTVVTIHDLIFKIFPEYYNAIDRAIYDRKFLSACERADKIVAVSQHTKQSIIENYKINPDKIEVIYLDTAERYHHEPDQDKVKEIRDKYEIRRPFFLNVGALGGRKNQLNLLEAYAAISDRTEVDLVFAGKPGKDLEAFNKLVKKCDLERRVTHISFITDEELYYLYHGSYATVYPSLYEGFGIPILESYRSGKPVLTSEGSSLEEVAGQAGLICNPKDVSSISEQLLKLTESEVYSGLQKNIKNELSRFHPKDSISKYMEMYTSMV